jgi:hypothetical protein
MPLQPFSALTPRSVAWLWPGRLALGKLAMLDGDPGLGKSFVTLDLCARLSTGRPFPDGTAAPGVSSALILNGEDDAQDTLCPRLQMLGADLARCFVIHEVGDAFGPLRLPTQTRLLDEALTHSRAQLLVLDPLMAFLDATVQTGNDVSVRRALQPLQALAEKHQCAVLLVRHLNKTSSRRALYRGSASIAFGGTCRSVWLIAADPQDSGRRILAEVKNNLGPPQPSLAYELVSAATSAPQPAGLRWLGTTTWRADQLLAAAAQASTAAVDLARACLLTLLARGPLTTRVIWEETRKHRLSRRTLYRARNDLKIITVRLRQPGTPVYYWLLPGQRLPASIPPALVPPDLEEWLAPLREQFPAPTPLDST